mmetsp:Transcript_19264/g.24837  ORF Transcript_19264/g.24837 Transcript_19264/m.24837 type:complete len:196 (+) Transcript_19264:145-732(+)|eukprot:CAMPEP_0198137370 /NCGR_PEP_ID=MMETSP1443-20131203/870_1 /TAXON_ID=186043 /ORGANISM="Entomoneis sp., Strain CCMP2396" /LENGTH=195 /DNA_ID=CAMNT_0043798775 /DNA_START=76 /DNA_END=663 /DNA_ORIENTATION=+
MNALRNHLQHAASASVRPMAGRTAALAFGIMAGAATPVVALCEEREVLPKDKDGNVDWMAAMQRIPKQEFWDDVATTAGDQVQVAIDSGVPTALSYGFISGYCSGLALKKAGRAAAGVLGLGFICLQTLGYYGYIKVDHSKLKSDVEGLLDLNNDGKVDAADRAIAQKKIMEVLQHGMPSGGGFAAGFVGGIRSG